MKAVVDVERTQAELDELYGEVSRRAGEPSADSLMVVLQALDRTVAEARRMALLIEQLDSPSWPWPLRDDLRGMPG